MKPLKIILTAVLAASATMGWAQIDDDFEPMGNGPGMQKVQAFRIAYISEAMALSAEDSVKFWKVHQEFDQKKRSIRQQMRELDHGAIAKSDAQLKEGIDQLFALKQQEVDLEKEYTDTFLKMLSVRQVVALFQAEREVKKELLKELQKMRGNRQGGGRQGRF